ncbi:MAG: hypothetical protein ACOC3Y_02095 [Desulfohalobiaceae bacterium]
MHKQMLACGLVTIILALSGCTYMSSNTGQRPEPKLNHLVIHQRPALEKAQEQVAIHPLQTPRSELKVLFFPFYISEQAGGNFDSSRKLSRIFWRTWLEEEVFPAMEFEDMQKWPGQKRLGQMASNKGADLYVQGQITHYMKGGTQGRTSISILVNIYTVANDELIWSLAHSGRIQRQTTKDFILFKTKSWMPEHPEYVIVNNLAQELAQPIKAWVQDKKEDS